MFSKAAASKSKFGLFVNSPNAQDSIYESGIMIYNHLKNSPLFELDYIEVHKDKQQIKTNYDFFAFNYHPATMPWLDIRSIRSLPGLKLTFVLETLPDYIFSYVPPESFDVFCPIDPTITKQVHKIYPLARPLESSFKKDRTPADLERPPVIGTFGFATVGKGYELVVDAVNREFDRATVRINIPPSTYMDHHTFKFHNRPFADYLSQLARQCAKPGIEVQVTHEYFQKNQLIEWCAENTLNCFLYSRDLPGLSATTDQAISSGQPLAVSDNPTFRHIHPYVNPYPFRSLRQSIEISSSEVLRIQQEWSSQNFISQFDSMLEECSVYFSAGTGSTASVQSLGMSPPNSARDRKINNLRNKLKVIGKQFSVNRFFQQGTEHSLSDATRQDVGPSEAIPREPFRSPKYTDTHILLVSHRGPRSQIHQYGINAAKILARSTRCSYLYVEVSNQKELDTEIIKYCPSAIIYNYHFLTMPWLSNAILRQYNLSQIGLLHGIAQGLNERADEGLFEYKFITDPTLMVSDSKSFLIPRPVPSFGNQLAAPTIPTIGSFSFSPVVTSDVIRLMDIVCNQYERAKILFHILNDSTDEKEIRRNIVGILSKTSAFAKQARIILEISYGTLTHAELLHFLASNTVNVFLSVENSDFGLSTATDYALAVQRPLAISRNNAFRHLFQVTPSICVEDSSLREIIDRDVPGLITFSGGWSASRFLMTIDAVIDSLLNGSRNTWTSCS